MIAARRRPADKEAAHLKTMIGVLLRTSSVVIYPRRRKGKIHGVAEGVGLCGAAVKKGVGSRRARRANGRAALLHCCCTSRNKVRRAAPPAAAGADGSSSAHCRAAAAAEAVQRRQQCGRKPIAVAQPAQQRSTCCDNHAINAGFSSSHRCTPPPLREYVVDVPLHPLNLPPLLRQRRLCEL